MYEENCAICFEKIDCESNSIKWEYLPCKHRICEICFIKLNEKNCPFCRKEIVENGNEDELAETEEVHQVEETVTEASSQSIDINIENDCDVL